MMGVEVDEGFDESWCVGMVCETKGRSSDKVSEGIQGRFLVTIIWCPLIGGQEGQDCGDIKVG